MTTTEKLQIGAKNRDLVTTSPKAVRREGFIPAVLYGHNVESTNLSVPSNEFEKLFRKAGESTLIELTTEDGKVHNVLIQEVQRHFLTTKPIHVDFLQVNMTETLKATVALEFIGESLAVKAEGGVLVKVLNEVEVECLPMDLPHNIEVDISAIKNFSDHITVKDLKVSSKVKILTDADEVVAKVQPPRNVEAELTPTEPVDISQVEVVSKEKKDEEVVEE
jgi:large subunit ribosomal protein L25